MSPTSPVQVFNLTTYPNLVGLPLEMLEVDTEPSEMSFALSIDGGAPGVGQPWAGQHLCPAAQPAEFPASGS